MDVKGEIRKYIASNTPEKVAVDHNLPVGEVKAWLRMPTFKAVDWFIEKVLIPSKGLVLGGGDSHEERYLKPHLLPHLQWESKNLSILFPTYRYTNPATAWTLVAFALDLGREKISMDMEFGDGQIDNARNLLAHRFLETKQEWSLWLDDDMVAPIGRGSWFKSICGLPPNFPDAIASQHAINRLMSHGKKIVGGTYYGRNASGKPIFAEARINPQVASDARAMKPRLVPSQWCGTGCLLVHRDVYLSIQERFPELAPTKARPVWDFFRRTTDTGEDLAFCVRANEAGYQIYVDLGLPLMHVGFCAWGPHNTKG